MFETIKAFFRDFPLSLVELMFYPVLPKGPQDIGPKYLPEQDIEDL